jgi:hypothetical protein
MRALQISSKEWEQMLVSPMKWVTMGPVMHTSERVEDESVRVSSERVAHSRVASSGVKNSGTTQKEGGEGASVIEAHRGTLEWGEAVLPQKHTRKAECLGQDTDPCASLDNWSSN